MKVYTPNGSFSMDDSVGLRGLRMQAYQDTIPFNHGIGPNFIACAICGLEDGEERIVCVKCPRSFHVKCFGNSGLPVATNESSLVDEDTPQKRECKSCEYDQLVRPDEDISSGIEEFSKSQAKRKIDKAYDRYKAGAQSYSFTSLILWELTQIVERLKSYEYGKIFSEPGEQKIIYTVIFIVPFILGVF
jgi:hypothetical protein